MVKAIFTTNFNTTGIFYYLQCYHAFYQSFGAVKTKKTQ